MPFAEMIAYALPASAVTCLAGFLVWKMRAGTSPLWCSVLVPTAIMLLKNADQHYLPRGFPAAMSLAGFASLAYLEWRAVHRSPPIQWNRRKVIITAVGLATVALTLAGVAFAIRAMNTFDPVAYAR